jgi:hypothetical protein
VPKSTKTITHVPGMDPGQYGADRGTRTPNLLRGTDFKSVVYTNSTMSAHYRPELSLCLIYECEARSLNTWTFFFSLAKGNPLVAGLGVLPIVSKPALNRPKKKNSRIGVSK